MACYDRVSCSVDPETGTLTINTKHGSCSVTPGDTVTFTETEVGYIITINGVPYIIPKPDEDDYGDNVDFTETEDSYIITINNIPHVIPKNCLRLIDCNGDDIDPCVDRIVTCDHLSEVIDNLPEPGEQTQVRNTGTGTVGQHTYIADHFGEYPNVTWRETWMERDGDIVTIHSWNPETNSWDSVAIEAPENLVILNNPVIYLRPNGSANPPINSQDDLTVANAFNSMQAIRSFMNRTYVFGTVTIDGRGQMFGGNVGPAQFKNAQNILIRGNPADASAFSFENAGSGGAAVSVTGGNVTFQDMTFRVRDEAVTPGRFGMVGNTSGGVATLAGVIRFAGYYDTTRAQAAPAYLMTAAGTSRTRIESGTQIITNFDNGTSFNAVATAFEGGTFDIGNNVVITHNTSFEATNIIYIQAASYWIAHMGNGAPPVVTGQDIVTSGPSVLCSNLSSTVASNWGVNMAGFFEWDWGQDNGVGELAPLGVYGGNAGPWP